MMPSNFSQILATLFLSSLYFAVSAYAAPLTCIGVAEIPMRLGHAKAGETICVKNGVYPDVKLNFEGHGRKLAPITLRAETTGKVIFTGNSSLQVAGQYLVVRGLQWRGVHLPNPVRLSAASECIVEDNTFIDTGVKDGSAEGAILLIAGSTGNLITHNLFQDLSAQGIKIHCAPDECGSVANTLSYNYFRLKAAAGANNGESIQLGQGKNPNVELRTSVEFNLFEDIGFSAELVSNKTRANIFRYNTFRHTDDQLVLRQGGHSEVYENWFLDAEGIRVNSPENAIHDNYFERPRGKNAIELVSGGEGPTCTHHPVVGGRVGANSIIRPVGSKPIGGFSLGDNWNTVDSEGCVYDQTPKGGTYRDNLLVGTVKPLSLVGNAQGLFVGNIYADSPAFSISGFVKINPELSRDSSTGALVPTAPEALGKGAHLHFSALKAADVGPRGDSDGQ